MNLLLHYWCHLLQGRSVNSYFLPNLKNFRVKLQNGHRFSHVLITPLAYFLLLLSRMRKPRPKQSCAYNEVTNENESYKVEKLFSTSPLSPATAVNLNHKQQRKLYSSYSSLLLTASLQLRELESCMPLVYLSSSDFNTTIAMLKAI